MNHGSWTVALFSTLLCNRCGRAGSQSRPHDSIPVSPGPDFQPHGKDGPNVLLPDTLGEPDSQRARAPGPFFSGRSGRSQRVHPGSRVSRVSTRCRAIQNGQNREPRQQQQRRCHPSPFSAAPVRGQRPGATMIHLLLLTQSSSLSSVVCGRRRRRRPSTRAGRVRETSGPHTAGRGVVAGSGFGGHQ